MLPIMDRRMLRIVTLAENMMKGSSESPPSCCSPSSSFEQPLLHFVLEAKVKWVKVGKRTMEGWEMTVLRMPRCQQEARPSSKPGRKMVNNVVATVDAFSSNVCGWEGLSPNGEASASPFPRRERRQAAKMSRNLGANT